MNYLMLVLRLIHIFAGVFWVGATLIMSLYMQPTTGGTGEANRQVVQNFITKARLFTAMTAAAILTVLAGYSMYWIDSNGFSSTWTHSGPGIGFAIGGAAGLLGLIFRVLANRNIAALKMFDVETKEQHIKEPSQKLESILKTQTLLNKLNTWSLIVAVFFMATARYLTF